jgi:uncharacterized membrane protein YfcA
MWIVGVTLGLIGGGGSILTVPILVYLFHLDPTQATGYSLFIVGATSLAGAIAHGTEGNVAPRVAAAFALPSLVSVYLMRRLVVPALPVILAFGPGLRVPRDTALMLGFAAIMALAAIVMIRSRNGTAGVVPAPRWSVLSALGLVVGAVAGFFGAGGGFLIVPALALVAGLSMQLAIGTSLTIISIQSLAGFVGVAQTAYIVDWPFIFSLSSVALTGMAVGFALCRRAKSTQLKVGFGWFVLVMSVVIALRELVSSR